MSQTKCELCKFDLNLVNGTWVTNSGFASCSSNPTHPFKHQVPDTRQRYVAGFMFDEDTDTRVALILKMRPKWQAGKLNAIGGKVEPRELPIEAMVREFREETGMETKSSQWKRFINLSGPEFVVDFFVTAGITANLRTMEEEHVGVFDYRSLTHEDVIPNLMWLVPMARLSLLDLSPDMTASEMAA